MNAVPGSRRCASPRIQATRRTSGKRVENGNQAGSKPRCAVYTDAAICMHSRPYDTGRHR